MAAPLTGQVPLSSTAQQLTTARGAGWIIKAPVTNSSTAYIGGPGVTTSTGFALDPGNTCTYESAVESGHPQYVCLLSDFWVAGTPGDKITWIASPST